jgi:hypothetical protein
LNAAFSDQIASLPTMSKAELHSIWAQNFSQAPPPSMRRGLMIPVLAYRIQEREFGGLSNAARKTLRDIAKTIDIKKETRGRGSSDLDRGTRLVRSWKGMVHEVEVSNGSFSYRGKQFGNLSQIAHEITGTRWSGPLFFGTKEKIK